MQPLPGPHGIAPSCNPPELLLIFFTLLTFSGEEEIPFYALMYPGIDGPTDPKRTFRPDF
jgi:hypothetical protein